jgi:glycosyltransferase involved in cell wall biosynthesis
VKIIIISPGFPPDWGGVESVTGSLARHLAARGEQVIVMTHGRKQQTEETAEGVQVHRYPVHLKAFAVSPALLRAMRHQRAAIWHVHNVHSSLPLLVWAARRRPYVLSPHFHGPGHTPAARLMHLPYRPILRRVVKSASAVIAVSHYEAALLEARFGVPVEIVPNGVDLEDLHSVARTRSNDDRVQILVISRLFPYKMTGTAIRALALLPEKYTLMIHGDGPEAAELQRLAHKMGVNERVHFQHSHLRDQDLWQLLANSDVLVNLSTAEAFSLVVLEALAVGTPVVLSTSTALRDWSDRFPEEVTAVLDLAPQTVAAAIERSVGRRVAPDLSAYDWDAITSQLLDIYSRVLG